MTAYAQTRILDLMPRLPLKGELDVTYRCNNNCRHCWIRLAPNAPERRQELGLDEIVGLVDQARAMGCREWLISGGEPILRPDFADLFDYITRKSTHYTLNTNGTLITPEIAKLLCRPGASLVALYGATSEVHDHITRTPGSFEATMRGFTYLREAGARSVVQLIPMRDNYHQWSDMQALAQSLSSEQRVGAAWLYLSHSGDRDRNREIAAQRLPPRTVIDLDQTAPERTESNEEQTCDGPRDDKLFAPCIASRRTFHIDPYGGMSFCSYVVDPDLRYDLRKGSVKECWETFIPSLAGLVSGGQEYRENCATCELRTDCRWCPVYGYLEHGRFSARVDYLCQIADENHRFKDNWEAEHRRYYQIAGITLQVQSDLPIADDTFAPKFSHFRIDRPGEDVVSIWHHFSLPVLQDLDLGREVYHRAPWAIYRKEKSWIYVGIPPEQPPSDEIEQAPMILTDTHRMVEFSDDYSRAHIYHKDDTRYRAGQLASLTMFPTDQVLIARLLADRQGCYIHSSGMVMHGQGLLFVGHSEAGKSTVVKMLLGQAETLCDDRNIVRRVPEGFRVYGTWSHGELPTVSSASAPLRAIMFLDKASETQLLPLTDQRQIVRKLTPCLIRPFGTTDWWIRVLDLVEAIAQNVPCYLLRFDKSGAVVDTLRQLLGQTD